MIFYLREKGLIVVFTYANVVKKMKSLKHIMVMKKRHDFVLIEKIVFLI